MHLKAICTLSVSMFAQSSHSVILGAKGGAGEGERQKHHIAKKGIGYDDFKIRRKISTQAFVDASRGG